MFRKKREKGFDEKVSIIRSMQESLLGKNATDEYRGLCSFCEEKLPKLGRRCPECFEEPIMTSVARIILLLGIIIVFVFFLGEWYKKQIVSDDGRIYITKPVSKP